jgi:two-component system LytT family response regulator
MTPKIRILVVDDEPLAREGIVAMLAQDPEVEVVGTAADGQTAVGAIRAQRPDLAFLDVQMPKRDGFEVLAELKPVERPHVIFVTAYDKYAIKAFESCAVDYLLKPFRDARFAAALARAKEEIRKNRVMEMGRKVEELLSHMHAMVKTGATPPVAAEPADRADRVVLKTGSDLHFIKTADIIWVESQADFVKVHTTGAAQLVRETLQSLEQRVDPARFLRIHRSSLVNLDHVKKVTPALYGDYTVLMSDDSKLRLSRKNRGKLKQLIARLSTAAEAD